MSENERDKMNQEVASKIRQLIDALSVERNAVVTVSGYRIEDEVFNASQERVLGAMLALYGSETVNKMSAIIENTIIDVDVTGFYEQGDAVRRLGDETLLNVFSVLMGPAILGSTKFYG